MSNKESLCACPNCKCRNGKACNCSPSCDCKMSNLEETKRESGVMVVQRVLLMVAVLCSSLGAGINATAADRPVEYRLLATSKTSTMERELNEAGAEGYRFSNAMGGETANGRQEIVVAMVKTPSDPGVRQYKLLATARTSTMQQELQEAANQGYEYRAQTVYETAFGGREVVIILERDSAIRERQASYKLLATTKTSTMQKELQEAGKQGYALLGLTIGKTAFGGDEVVAIVGKD
jgi:hypothetical protein